MTLERYAHHSTEADRAAAKALQGHFSEAFAGGSRAPSVEANPA